MPEISTKLDVKDAILDATDVLLARYGYRKMTVEDIAVEAGIGKGTVYLHFSSKEEVVLSHIDRIVDRLKQRMWAISRSNSSTAERLREMLLTRVLFRFDSIQHEFEFQDALSVAYALLNATNGLLPYSLSATELGAREDVAERAAGVADLLLHGL